MFSRILPPFLLILLRRCSRLARRPGWRLLGKMENYDWVGSCKRLPCAVYGADAMYRISNEA